jgi:hypothetical protein
MKGFLKINDDETFSIQTPYHVKVKEAITALGPIGWDNDIKAYQFEINKLDELKNNFRKLGVSLEKIDSMPIKIYGVKIAYIRKVGDNFEVFVPYLECLTKIFKSCEGNFDRQSYIWSFQLEHKPFIVDEIKKLNITIDESSDFPTPKAQVVKVK